MGEGREGRGDKGEDKGREGARTDGEDDPVERVVLEVRVPGERLAAQRARGAVVERAVEAHRAERLAGGRSASAREQETREEMRE